VSDGCIKLLHHDVGFLARAAAREALALYRPLLAPLGLSHAEYTVLLALEDGRDHPVTDLAARIALPEPGVASALASLDDRGLIRWGRLRTDPRRGLVSMTPSGVALLPQLEAISEQVRRQLDA